MYKKTTLGILVMLVVVVIFNFFQIQTLKVENAHLENLIEKQSAPEEIEIADVMAKLQRHMNKLWFAGNEENWDLAGFYVHELEEAMHEISDGNVVEDNIQLSPMMDKYGLLPLNGLEKSIKEKNKEELIATFNESVIACNNCHKLSQHSFIQITIPESPALDNQQYTPIN